MPRCISDQQKPRFRPQALYVLLIGLFPVGVCAQPAPVGFAARVITGVRIPDVEDSTVKAVLEAYQCAATQMGWKIPQQLAVSVVHRFFIPEGSGARIHVIQHRLGKDVALFRMTVDPRVFQRLTDADLVNDGWHS